MIRHAKLFKVTALFLLPILLAGCFRMQLETKELDQSVFLSSKSPKEFTRLKEFSVKTNGSWMIFGLVTLKTPELASIIKDEIARQQGDAVINLTIKSQTTFTDGLIGFIAILGLLYQPRSVFVTGTVVSLNKDTSMQSMRSVDLVHIRQSSVELYRAEGFVNEKTEFNF